MAKASELVELAKMCQRKKTLYAKGAFGAPLNEKNKIRYKVDHDVDPSIFLFDCCGLWHALCSGWNANSTATYGGTQVNKEANGISYGAYHIPDWGADGAFSKNYLVDISNDMSTVLPGEILWIPGHNGICIKPGWSIECTPRGEGGVQITQWIDKKLPNYREWLQHGKLPFLEYDNEDVEPASITCPCCGARFVLNG